MSTAMETPIQSGQEPLTSERYPMLLFFDGECAFCNLWVAKVKDADRARRIRYGIKQGRTFQQVARLRPDLAKVESVVLFSRRADGTEEVTVRSRAIREVIKGLPEFRFFELMLQIFPTPVSDLGYRIFSKLRAPLFGKWAHCRRPIEQDKELYVE
ncbi:MAG: DCC1-like thiol-disulfide oxidoreductase family protein [Methylacidiphilales bacterium]|nr:DCC1-like thiol-disulfide oxidoreductase family protein [Candidatus Methylacidiphilales bacterium]